MYGSAIEGTPQKQSQRGSSSLLQTADFATEVSPEALRRPKKKKITRVLHLEDHKQEQLQSEPQPQCQYFNRSEPFIVSFINGWPEGGGTERSPPARSTADNGSGDCLAMRIPWRKKLKTPKDDKPKRTTSAIAAAAAIAIDVLYD